MKEFSFKPKHTFTAVKICGKVYEFTAPFELGLHQEGVLAFA
jgi:hypothetical protein